MLGTLYQQVTVQVIKYSSNSELPYIYVFKKQDIWTVDKGH